MRHRDWPHFLFGIQHQHWASAPVLFSICWVRPDALNPNQEVLVEAMIYDGDIIRPSDQSLSWRAEKNISFIYVIDHCCHLADSIQLGEWSPFDLRTDNGWFSREIFLAGLHERGVKIVV